MGANRDSATLPAFPCRHEFKAFGVAADAGFEMAVREAVSRVVPVGEESIRRRISAGGRYQCVTVLARLENGTQLVDIYAKLRGVDGLCYLL